MGAHKKKVTKLLAECDVSCPECGDVNSVRIAGVHDFPRTPENWYCRCYSCDKSFKPRRKESDNLAGASQAVHETTAPPARENEKPVTKMDAARKALPREKFEKLIKRGFNDTQVAKHVGFDTHTIKRIKMEYKLTEERHAKTKSYRRKLPRAIFEELIRRGLTDREIAEAAGLEYNQALQIKKGYKLTGFSPYGRKANRRDKVAAAFETHKKKISVKEAVELRDRLVKEEVCVKAVMERLTGLELTPAVEAALKGIQEGCTQKLERLNKVFESTQVEV